MRRKLFALFLLLVLLIGYFAYLNSLPPAVRAYKLARIPGDEKLIAVYHDEDFWQFATYNKKTNTLKLYTVEQYSPLWLKKRKVESVKALVNYTPLALDLKLLKSYEPHSKALLFKTLGWKYEEDISGSYWTNLSEVIHPGEECYRIYGIGSSDKIWIKSKKVCTVSTFVGEMRCYGSVGMEGLLVFPAYESSRLLWVKEKPGAGGNVELFAYYPGAVLREHETDLEEEPSIYTGRDEKIILRILKRIEKGWGVVQVVVAPGKYASGSFWGSQYCIVGIPWGSNQTEVGEPYCRPAKWLSLRG